MEIGSIDELQNALKGRFYIADRGLATAVYLALKLERPLFLEGEPGVGKTEIAKTLAELLQTDLIRLQCYEGLDINHAVYEWNYTRQMLHIRLLESRGEKATEGELFGADYLLKRPLLQAIEESRTRRPVLLIDEIDRSDEEFEAFLLEILSDFQVTIPEIGTLKARHKPVVILTSNRTREVHDALKRRCLYYWIDYPTFEKEYDIVRAKVPHAPDMLARQVTAFIQELREADLYKIPGVAETLDWTAALVALDQQALTLDVVNNTLGVILKYQDDIERISSETARLMLERIRANA
ncbi:MAG: MoxR family ATPase [Chloroflexi bacterium]|nr:MoxR family ATPase [Ardenticatenaceae bacterium]MBL1127314.1 MoxR family ATPase [Chloroflexota bacterium]NOG33375.1 MoxR family ATPase [Chloroflexota bacterium]GIK57223.1 MAG: ATPase [Chloroflexota bacterium]